MQPRPEPKDLKILHTEAEIAERVASLAREIALALPDDLMMVALLRGSFVFASDLIRAMHKIGAKPQVDFMTLQSYHEGTQSSGKVIIHRDIVDDIAGRDVLILDDILESGRTLQFAKSELLKRNVKSVHVAVMLEKPGKRKVGVEADFVGFTIPDHFVVGYGLDYANYYRELPYIAAIEV